ncbi:hypothetical protein ACR9E3_24390 [Actinomycetospora sp. C-140]
MSGSGGLWQIVLGWVPTLLWAGVVLTALVLLRAPLRDLISRVGTVKVAGVDVSFVAADLGAAAAAKNVQLPATAAKGVAQRAAEHADQLHGARLLWLDARPTHNRAERQALRALGIEVTAVTGLQEAVDLVERTDPDVVLTNYGASNNPPTAVALGRAVGDLAPVIVYSVGTQGKPLATGCFGQTDRPDQLLHLVIDAMERAHPYRQP